MKPDYTEIQNNFFKHTLHNLNITLHFSKSMQIFNEKKETYAYSILLLCLLFPWINVTSKVFVETSTFITQMLHFSLFF